MGIWLRLIPPDSRAKADRRFGAHAYPLSVIFSSQPFELNETGKEV